MKTFAKKLLYLALVAVVSYTGAGIVRVPANATAQVSVGTLQNNLLLPYLLKPGIYWIDPRLNVRLTNASWGRPTTQQFLDMALYYDKLFDAEVDADALHNPITEEETEAMAQVIITYIKKLSGPFLVDFEYNGLEFFTPDLKGATRYDSELAHWARVKLDENKEVIRDENQQYINDNRIHINLPEMRRTKTRGDESFMGTLTHEMVHGALAITLDPGMMGRWDQETINQALTSEVLRLMAEDGVPGAEAALYDHLRMLALFSAAFRAQFGTGLEPMSYLNALDVGELSDRYYRVNPIIDPGWEPAEFYFYRDDVIGAILNWFKGNPYYHREIKVTQDSFAITNESIRLYHSIQQNGIHYKTSRLIDLFGPQPWLMSILRTLFGPTYAHVDIAIVKGEADAYAETRIEALGSLYSSVDGREYWETNNSYFFNVWWKYQYSPLMIMIYDVYWNMHPTWRGATTSDFNEINLAFMGGPYTAVFVMVPRTFEWPKEEWKDLLAPLNLQAHEPAGLCANRDCTIARQDLRPDGWMRLFPGAVWVFALFLLVEWPTRKGLAILKRRVIESYQGVE